MPPRANLRRSTRVTGRDSSASASPLANLQKPNLPVLQGTPSSRRQYTYGAEVEPPPARPGRGLSGQKLDLGRAVKDVLTRQAKDDETDKIASRTSRDQLQKRHDHLEEDELATDRPFRPVATREATKPAVAQVQSSESSEASDTRSFAIESDYYGDATIASTPATLPQPSDSRSIARAASAEVQQPISNHQPATAHYPRLQDLPEDNVSDTTRPKVMFQQAAEVIAERSTKPASRSAEESSKPNPFRRRSNRTLLRNDDSSDDEEAEVISKQASFGVRRKVNTPGPSTGRQGAGDSLHSKTDRDARPPIKRPEPKQPVRRRPTSDVEDPANQSKPIEKRPHDARNRLSIKPGRASGPSLFERARSTATSVATSPFSRSFRAPPLPMHDLRDAAVQNTIHRQIREAEEEEDWQQRLRARRARVQVLKDQWASAKAQLNSFFTAPDDPDEDSGPDEREPGNYDAINWWELLYPSTYWEAILWSIGLVGQAAVRFQGLVGPRLGELARYAFYITGGMLALILALILSSATVAALQESSLSLPSMPGSLSFPQVDFDDVKYRVGQYIPDIPEISWPSWGGRDELPNLWEMDHDERREVKDLFKEFTQELKNSKNAVNLHESSLKKLQTVLPKVVHMQLKNGKPVIAQEFYHGLRDLAHEDGSFLMLDKNGKDYEISSQKHWQAIVSKLGSDPTFTSKLDLSMERLEGRLDSKMSNSWDVWVKNNNGKISELIGSELGKIQLAGSDKEFDKRLSKIVKDHLDESKRSGTVVSRDEFLRHLKNDFVTHRSEIRAELKELTPKLEEYVREVTTRDAPVGMSKVEITTLVDGLVRKSIADMNLKAMAKGRIHAHWDADLKNQVNYFNVGSGATINPKFSSQTYDPVGKTRKKTEAVYRNGIRSVIPHQQISALMPWQDEGDCWCAARSLNHRGNPHGANLAIQLSHSIVPQHIVVEHVLPGATTDPEARPRDIEVYAEIESEAVRERTRDFSATQFPDDKSVWDFQPAQLPERFVKIGQFVYEGAELNDGVYVHRLSDELLELRAETDQVVVRATSNYGAKEHTCFYRVRLFGHKLDVEQ